jgi:hypothetical protein
MDLIGKQVIHKSFGDGIVVGSTDSHIEVHFSEGNKTFVFPDAFSEYLIMVDKNTADAIKELLQIKAEVRKQDELVVEEDRLQQIEKRKLHFQNAKLLDKHKIDPRSQSVFWCKAEDKDKVFKEWKVFTGLKKSGFCEGQISRPLRLNKNSACLITARDSGMKEKDRRILGVYMVSTSFDKNMCKDGYISAHPKYRLQLSKKESEKMLFWNYYVNEKFPNGTTWNSGIYRYFNNLWMAQILRDIVALKKDSQEQELAQQFFEYFCQMNQIDMDKISEPNGALMRIKD